MLTWEDQKTAQAKSYISVLCFIANLGFLPRPHMTLCPSHPCQTSGFRKVVFGALWGSHYKFLRSGFQNLSALFSVRTRLFCVYSDWEEVCPTYWLNTPVLSSWVIRAPSTSPRNLPICKGEREGNRERGVRTSKPPILAQGSFLSSSL